MNGKVLLAHQKGADNTFLPGGHVKFGEKAEAALIRELAEETGEQALIRRFIGAVECMWTEDDQEHHEVSLIFEVIMPDLDTDKPPQSQESHLEFLWAKPADLEAHNLLPKPMRECVVNWNSGCHPYWGSSFYD